MHDSRASGAATTPSLNGAPVGRRVEVTLTEDERALALAFWARAGVVEGRTATCGWGDVRRVPDACRLLRHALIAGCMALPRIP